MGLPDPSASERCAPASPLRTPRTDENAAYKDAGPNPSGGYPKAASWPRWMLALNGRPYRFVMRLMHRHGWCYPSRTLIQPQMVWCHWCGMRGRVPSDATAPEFQRAVAKKMAASDRTGDAGASSVSTTEAGQ